MKFNLFIIILHSIIFLSISTNKIFCDSEKSNENIVVSNFNINEIQPSDSDSVIVAKIQHRAALIQNRGNREQSLATLCSTLIFSAAFLFFSKCLRDGLLG